MEQTTDQIEAYIQATHHDLGANLKELENRVKSVTDWKEHFHNSPMTMISVAFGAGIVLAAALGGKRRRGVERAPFSYGNVSPTHTEETTQRPKSNETWDTVRGALIGVAATRFKDFVGEIVPGFSEHLQRSEAKTKSSHGPFH